MLVDTHTHLYDKAFDSDRDDVVERARNAGVEVIIQPAVDAESIDLALDLCGRYEGLYAMAAIHPTSVQEATEKDMARIEEVLGDPRVVAVGETGLDYYWDRAHIDLQHEMLRRHARLAIDADLPLILHNRDQKGSEESSRDLVRILSEEKATYPGGDSLYGIFHCFGGPKWLGDQVMNLGFYIGLGGTLTFKNGGVPEAIKDIPLDRVVLETDAPYLAPVPHRGKRNEPAYVKKVAEKLAEVREMSLKDVSGATTETARRLFKLP